MSQDKFRKMLQPYIDRLTEFGKIAYEDFNKVHADAMRLSVEKARPKWVSERTLWLFEREWGTKGKIRIATNKRKDLRFLLIEGHDFNIAIRPKKCDGQWRSSNAYSEQQRELRRTGEMTQKRLFPARAYNFVLGWRDDGGLQPVLTHLALVWERRGRVDIVSRLWTAEEGTRPIQQLQQEIPDVSEAPPQPKIEPKKRKDAAGDGEAKTG